MRPKQWTKNLLLFAGLVFAHRIGDIEGVVRAATGFLIFCGLSGCVYLVNDIRDRESDRQHPLKRKRPIAAGVLGVAPAGAAAAALAVAGILGSFMLNNQFGATALFYLVMMLAYSVWLKHIVIVDLMVISMGFVIRGVAGVKVIEHGGEYVPITPWFVTCILFLALFIAICKRRHELVLLADGAKEHRPVLDHYSVAFLDQMINVATSATVISYALYVVMGVKKDAMILTLPFVLYGIFRYLYLVYKKEKGGRPEALLLQDTALLVNVLLWLVTVIIVFYR